MSVKTKVELSADTVKTLERARAILAKNPDYRWMKYLPLDGFIDIFFGGSPLSEHCRRLLNDAMKNELTLEEEVTLPEPDNPVGYYLPKHAPIIKVFLKYGNDLSASFIAKKIGFGVSEVRSALRRLKLKGILKPTPSKRWKLDKEELSKWGVRQKPAREAVADLLKKEGHPLPISEIRTKLPEYSNHAIRGALHAGDFIWKDGKWRLKKP